MLFRKEGKKRLPVRLLLIVLALVLVIGMMSGCTKKENEVEVPTTTEGGIPADAGGRLGAIRDAGKLTVATEPYFAPEEFIDPSKTGQDQFVGSDMELARLIAERMGVELEIVPLEFGPVITSVVEGKYDLAISALAYTAERAEAMELSIGYHFTDESKTYGLLIRKEDADTIKGPEDLSDKIVVTQSGSIQEALVLAQIPAYKEFKKVSSMSPDAFLSVQEGKADAAAVSCENAQLYIDSNPDCGLVVLDSFYFIIDAEFGGERIGAPKGETELIEFVNAILEEVNESGQYEAWFSEYAEYAASLGL